jgi:hypothetical protein
VSWAFVCSSSTLSLLRLLHVEEAIFEIKLNHRISASSLHVIVRLYSCLFYYYLCILRPPLWCSGQRSRLQIQRTRFDSRRHQIFLEVVGLKRGPLSLRSTIEELPERKSSSSGLENRDYCRSDPQHWPRDTPLKVGNNVAYKRWLLGRYSSPVD